MTKAKSRTGRRKKYLSDEPTPVDALIWPPAIQVAGEFFAVAERPAHGKKKPTLDELDWMDM